MSKDGTRLAYSTGGPPPVPATAKEPARAPSGKGVRVRVSKKPGGREVTEVLGLPGTDRDLEELARALRAACGAGGTVRGDAVEIQGEQRDKVIKALAARGIKAR